MHNVFRLVARTRMGSVPSMFPALTKPLQVMGSPPPSAVLKLQVSRLSCGRSLAAKARKDNGERRQCSAVKGKSSEKANKRQCSSVKGKKGQSKERGAQCSEVKNNKGEGKQLKNIKGKRGASKERGDQCTEIKGKRDKSYGKQQCGEVKGKKKNSMKGAQFTEVKGKCKDTDAKISSNDCSCSLFDAAKNSAKATTVVCEGDKNTYSFGEKVQTCSSSSSSEADSECSEGEEKNECKTEAEEDSELDEVPKKECVDEPIDQEQEERNRKAVTEMCSCIQSALANTKTGPKKDTSTLKHTKNHKSICGSSKKEDAKPKVSEHVTCCNVETSKTASLSSNNKCKVDKEEEECSKHEDVDVIKQDEKIKSKNDPCECIKKAVDDCKKGNIIKTKSDTKKHEKLEKKNSEPKKLENEFKTHSKSCPSSTKSSKEETSGEEKPSQCGSMKNGKKQPPFC
ncbi:axoneme-associated protein mst101(2)-like [Macrosteles quadrilineatus]|uniref:axoneme-associated protein mst101(2)-like n=1 Tax=Macrosteles quadrilineatus TaxID=74068 RepID=UPI0023E17BAF|nr:axoneme-associated protein mst101(2)-like [Macrosteles quadrilineatus]